MRLFQNRVSESVITLPLTVVIVLAAVVLAGLYAQGEWFTLPAMALAGYAMIEKNNRNMLLRVRSRMVSCSFMMLSLMCGYVNTDLKVALVQLLMVAALFLISITYRNRKMVGVMFYAFLCVGLASTLWIPVLWMVPLLLLFIFRPLFSISLRTFSVMLFGILLPYCFLATYYLYAGNMYWWEPYVAELTDYSAMLDYSRATYGMLANYVVLLLLTLFGTIHFMRYSYEDRIQVRMVYWMNISLAVILLALCAVVPGYGNYLIPILCIPVGILTAHFFTNTHSKFTNITFVVMLLMTILVTIFNQCLTSLSSLVLGASL